MSIGVLDKDGAPQTINTINDLLAIWPASLSTKTKSGSLPVTLASDEGILTNLGIVTETAPASDTASSGLNGRLQRIAQNLTSLSAKFGALGSTTASGSQPVTIATDDGIHAKLGIVTETAPASDTASSGLNGRLQRIAQRLSSLIALQPAALGSAAAASSFAVTASTEDIARIGIITETAPALDTASSGLNGRLQRIAQRITSMIALLPTSLGQKTMSASLPVVLPSDQAIVAAGTTKVIKITPTMDTSAYAAGDVFFATTAAALSRANDTSGVILDLTVIDKDDNKPAFYIVIMNANNALGTFNVAPTISDANASAIIGIIEISAGDYKDLGGVSVAHVRGLVIPFQPASGTQNVYIASVLTAGTPTHTASGIDLNFGVSQD